MKVSEKKRQLQAIGCYKVDEGGEHEKWYSPVTEKFFRIPRHDSKELATGTANRIDKDAGLK